MKVEVQAAAGRIGGVEEVERDEVVGIGVGAIRTIDITVVLIESVTVTGVTMVTVVTVLITAVFPVSNAARMTLSFSNVSSVGADFITEDTSVIITYIIHVVAVNAAAVIVNAAPAAGVVVLSFAVLIVVVIICI